MLNRLAEAHFRVWSSDAFPAEMRFCVLSAVYAVLTACQRGARIHAVGCGLDTLGHGYLLVSWTNVKARMHLAFNEATFPRLVIWCMFLLDGRIHCYC